MAASSETPHSRPGARHVSHDGRGHLREARQGRHNDQHVHRVRLRSGHRRPLQGLPDHQAQTRSQVRHGRAQRCVDRISTLVHTGEGLIIKINIK